MTNDKLIEAMAGGTKSELKRQAVEANGYADCEDVNRAVLDGRFDLYSLIRAALAAAEAAGYRLVPREPEPERLKAIEWQIGSGVKTWGTTRAIYDAAIAAPQPEAAPETFVGVTESGHYSYHDCAKSSRHGWMQCTACRSPITSGEYRTREHADRYATWHRDCCPDDPHWRERDAMSQTAAERIEDYQPPAQESGDD